MSTRELKRIQPTHGFDVALKNARHGRIAIRYKNIDNTPPPPPPPPPPQTPKKKKWKRANPYAGPSGVFSRKPRWSKAKKHSKLNLEDVKTTEEEESASDASLPLPI